MLKGKPTAATTNTISIYSTGEMTLRCVRLVHGQLWALAGKMPLHQWMCNKVPCLKWQL